RFAMPLTSVPVEEFTTPDPVTASERMTIDELQRLMERHGIRHLPVVRGDAVVGVLSDRDVRLLYGLSAAEKLQVRAADIMSPAPLTVSAATPLDEVAFAMSDQKVGSVIVNDEDGRFLGIFTAIDALNALVEIIRRGRAAASRPG
ncbi:MAG TPA: CBS domain-containing protein, partial [Rubrivivax sp.]|nr:CBS domain-containing protein [Rubrivivax sp.]